MNRPPDTRLSLIARLPNASDHAAWQEYLEIYEPLMLRLARKRGLQPADAEDFVQEVHKAIATSVERWLSTANRGPFRAWLFRIASNLAVNFLTRRRHQRLGSGDTNVQQLLAEVSDRDSDASQEFELEYRREVFRWAAKQVQPRVADHVWQAFWRTAVEGHPIASVARELGISVGAVYLARSRLTNRIATIVKRHEEKSE